MTHPVLNSIEPIAQLLPLRTLVVTLRFTQQAEFQFYHHVAVHAWVRHLCGSPEEFSQQITVQTLENGKTQYQLGELYRFKLVFTPQGSDLIQPLIEKLRNLPMSAKQLPAKACLSNNVELTSLTCGISCDAIEHVLDIQPYGLEALAQDVAYWQQRDEVLLETLTPTRFLLPKEVGQHLAGGQRYCRDKAHLSSETVTLRWLDTYIGLIESHTGVRFQRDVNHLIAFEAHLSFWVEHRYGRGEIKQKKPLGGALFAAKITNLNQLPKWLVALLVLGQWLGVGQSRAMGLGLYWLREAGQALGANSDRLLQQYFTKANLNALVEDSLSNQFTEQQYHTQRLAVLQASEVLLNNEYHTPRLHQVEIEKSDGGVRTLSIPPLTDRILQKAVARPLAMSLDGLWKTHSYGYRKGLSRHDAKFAINKAIQQGYQWVLESDVESFFDRVDWQNLETRLKLLLPNDAIVPLIMAWVKAPIKTPQGQYLERSQGLPQGSPLSPLLASIAYADVSSEGEASNAKSIQVQRYVVSIDVESFDNREKLNQLLLQYGERVQYNLFEIMLFNEDQLNTLRSLGKAFLSTRDSLRFYPLSNDNIENGLHICGEENTVSPPIRLI